VKVASSSIAIHEPFEPRDRGIDAAVQGRFNDRSRCLADLLQRLGLRSGGEPRRVLRRVVQIA
jgi:hypothetical protein